MAVESAAVFQYLFAIFNSLQGFFLFIFYCVLKRDAQLAWLRTCPCFEYDGGYTSSSTNRLNGELKLIRFMRLYYDYFVDCCVPVITFIIREETTPGFRVYNFTDVRCGLLFLSSMSSYDIPQRKEHYTLSRHDTRRTLATDCAQVTCCHSVLNTLSFLVSRNAW